MMMFRIGTSIVDPKMNPKEPVSFGRIRKKFDFRHCCKIIIFVKNRRSNALKTKNVFISVGKLLSQSYCGVILEGTMKSPLVDPSRLGTL
jgi:hypothetical protein